MNKQKRLSKIFIASMLLSVPALAITGGAIHSLNQTQILSAATNGYSESLNITNSSFASSNSTYTRNDVSGWSRIKGDGSATTMIIDTVNNYSSYKTNTYYLSLSKEIDSANTKDNKVLMINSALKANQKDGYANEGYKSSDISLNANAYYYFEVSMKTASFNEATEFASIYLSGLKDENDKAVKAQMEMQTAKDWTKYYFFVATGNSSQTVSLNLWLGSELLPSYGVAFFDEVYVCRYSENLFYEKLYTENSVQTGSEYEQKSTTKFIDLTSKENQVDVSGRNFDFEEDVSEVASKLKGWKISESLSNISNANAQILNLDANQNFYDKTSKNSPKSDYSYKNNQALTLWTNKEGYITVENTDDIKIDAHGYYKVKMYVKTDLDSGAFTLKAVEQETIFDEANFPELKNNYTLHEGKASSITNSSGTKFDNDYQIVELFIEGNQLYNSYIKLQLCLGSENEKALGYVVVDDITIEKVSQSAYNDASETISLAFNTVDSTIKNGMFNNISSEENSLEYPLSPANFTISASGKNGLYAGIINTYSKYFDNYSLEPWGNFANPAKLANSPASDTVSNNILMFYNGVIGYQTVRSSDSISVPASTYATITFDYISYGNPITFTLIDDDSNLLYTDENIYTSGAWGKYSVTIYTGESSHNIIPVIKFGSETNPVNGYAFIDNIEYTTVDENSYGLATNKVDLSNFLLNIDPYKNVGSSLTNHVAFNGSLENGSFGEGGVIIGEGNTSYTDQNGDFIDKDETLENNVLVIRVNENSTYTLKSKFKLSLGENKYYLLKFKLLTNFLPDEDTLPSKDEDGKAIEYKYGVNIGVEGYENVKRLSSNDGWTEYSILYKVTSAEESNFVFSLVSDVDGLNTVAYLTDITWTESTSDVFESAEINNDYNKTLFTSVKETEDENDESDEEDTSNQTSTSNDFNWLLIPTLIMALALVIAIVGIIIRKVSKGKKTEEKPKEKYDRKETVNKEFVKKEARKIQESEIKNKEKAIKDLEAELETIEKDHKEYIEESRTQNNGKITKEIERQFKIYGSKRSKIIDKINVSKEQLETLKSADYLLTLEKKVERDSLKTNKTRDSLKNKQNK